jgi:hypothetical protein
MLDLGLLENVVILGLWCPSLSFTKCVIVVFTKWHAHLKTSGKGLTDADGGHH